ncbi:MAG: Vitamin B12-binding protein [Planctomycetes bacterium]|nr:Vitamin B12-binding protein [Planctomycetota bacterium]
MNDDVTRLLAAAPPHPRRIVCLTEETTETLHRIGAMDLVVGVSGYTVRPPEARRKPRVSAFLTAKYDEILALRPDLVVGFSDLQAPLAAELVKRGVPVVVFNQRSVAEILQTIRVTGAIVGRGADADALAAQLAEGVRAAAERAASLPRRPRVFLEEWHDPLISGIRWVSELAGVAGADDVFPELRAEQGAKGRIVDPREVARRDPELVIASWCGRKASRDVIRARAGWERVAAVRDDQLYEIKSTYILQPGPAALTDGLAQLGRIVAAAARGERLPPRRAGDLRRADG